MEVLAVSPTGVQRRAPADRSHLTTDARVVGIVDDPAAVTIADIAHLGVSPFKVVRLPGRHAKRDASGSSRRKDVKPDSELLSR